MYSISQWTYQSSVCYVNSWALTCGAYRLQKRTKNIYSIFLRFENGLPALMNPLAIACAILPPPMNPILFIFVDFRASQLSSLNKTRISTEFHQTQPNHKHSTHLINWVQCVRRKLNSLRRCATRRSYKLNRLNVVELINVCWRLVVGYLSARFDVFCVRHCAELSSALH